MTWAELGTLGIEGYKAIEAGRLASINNQIRRYNNDIATTNAAATNWMKGVNNRAIAETMAAESEALKETMARTQDAQTTAGLESSIAAMEAAGAFAANSVAAGMAGVSSDILASTLTLRTNIAKEAVERNNGQVSYEFMKQIAGTQSAGVLEQDLSVVLPQRDFRRDRAPNIWTAIFTSKDSVKALSNLGSELSKANFDWFGTKTPPSYNDGGNTSNMG